MNRPEISSHVRSSALKKYLADGDADSLVFYMDIRLAAIEDYEDETAKDLKLTYSLTPIGGKWYYLNPVSDGSLGICYLNTTTPDGYKVDENGAWIQ